MLFKHPELLYGLFLLVIPVLVHLFQLRRFRRERFTNVKFLKKVVLQTRKSSRIKKWLVLLLRLLLFASLIIAFAQPYIPFSETALNVKETVIYLDNSYSMQAKGREGNLLKRSIQDLLEVLPKDEKITLFTNDREFVEADYSFIKKELQSLPYSPTQLDWRSISAKAANQFSENLDSDRVFLAISDFQVHEGVEEMELHANFTSYLVKLQAQTPSNVAIDTVFITEQSLDEITLNIKIKASGKALEEIPVSLYNGPDLLAKRTVALDEGNSTTVEFPLPSAAIEKGRIEIEDEGMEFDNTLHFSMNERKPIEVVVIGDSDAEFLERIYRGPEFNIKTYATSQIEFSELSKADLVILNEPESISLSLNSTLGQLVKENVFMVIIPSEQGLREDYNALLRSLDLPQFQEGISDKKLITEIVYDHPLFNSVFDEKVENFQYPEVASYFRLTRRGEKILGLENNEEFLLRRGNIFLFTAALNSKNSNFQNAPLIVPTFYNLGNLALTPAQLYYTLGKSNQIDISLELDKDEILSMVSENSSFIPLQQSFPNKVVIDLQEIPVQPGHYYVQRDSSIVRTLSFNVNRQESLLEYQDLGQVSGAHIETSVPAVFEAVESKSEINALWKWFVIFALFFLLMEMFILKFFK